MRSAARTRRTRARAPGLVGAPTLRSLADLVDQALTGLGAQPAFASEAVRRQATVPGAATRAVNGVRVRGHTARNLPQLDDPDADYPDADYPDAEHTDAGDAASEPAAGVRDDDVDPEMDDDHVQTWRLVRLAQGGDGEAFGLLYDRYVDMVFRFVYHRVNDRALAEDFTSETFLRALRRIGTISYQGRDIGAWFVTIARNIVLDHVKSARNRLEWSTADTIEGKEHAPSTENAVISTLESEHLMAAVGRLGDEQRECVTLRFVHGLSVNETASIMGKNDGAIKALQHRAVRKLSDLMGDDLR